MILPLEFPFDFIFGVSRISFVASKPALLLSKVTLLFTTLGNPFSVSVVVKSV